MIRRRGLASLLAAAALLTGCGSDPGQPSAASSPTSDPTVGPLGSDAFAVRDDLVARVRESGGTRISVTGRPSVTDLDLVYDEDGQRFSRRFSWQADGEALELLELSTGRVCANLAAGRALPGPADTGMDYLVASDRPYSCTTQGDNLAGFLIYGYAALDPVTRLAGLMGSVTLTDLGAETEADGTPTRHVQVRASESDRSMRSVPTTYDLWVDADHRLVRAEFTSLDEEFGPYVATFAYGGADPVTLPPDHGGFIRHPAVG